MQIYELNEEKWTPRAGQATLYLRGQLFVSERFLRDGQALSTMNGEATAVIVWRGRCTFESS